jgi:hypothetical protein
MRERRGRIAEVYPSPSQLQQQSRSAHLLSIRLEQYGLPFHAAAYVHLQLKKCCGFLELEVDHVIGCEKALRSWMRNRELHPTTESFCAVDGVRARQLRKTADLAKIVTINEIHTTYAWTLSVLYIFCTVLLS